MSNFLSENLFSSKGPHRPNPRLSGQTIGQTTGQSDNWSVRQLVSQTTGQSDNWSDYIQTFRHGIPLQSSTIACSWYNNFLIAREPETSLVTKSLKVERSHDKHNVECHY